MARFIKNLQLLCSLLWLGVGDKKENPPRVFLILSSFWANYSIKSRVICIVFEDGFHLVGKNYNKYIHLFQ